MTEFFNATSILNFHNFHIFLLLQLCSRLYTPFRAIWIFLFHSYDYEISHPSLILRGLNRNCKFLCGSFSEHSTKGMSRIGSGWLFSELLMLFVGMLNWTNTVVIYLIFFIVNKCRSTLFKAVNIILQHERKNLCVCFVLGLKFHEDHFGHFSCNKCDKTFKRKSGLNQHSKYSRCSNAMMFGCEFCPKRFNRRDTLKTHMQFVHYTDGFNNNCNWNNWIFENIP